MRIPPPEDEESERVATVVIIALIVFFVVLAGWFYVCCVGVADKNTMSKAASGRVQEQDQEQIPLGEDKFEGKR